MTNTNYLKGRRFEYDRMAYYRELGMKCMRTAGSHGEWDLIAYDPRHVYFIQCKVTADPKDAYRKLKAFREAPPTSNVTEILDVKVVGSTAVQSASR